MHRTAGETGVRAGGHGAITPQGGQEGPLGVHAAARAGILDRRQQVPQFGVTGPALHRKSPLANLRHHQIDRQSLQHGRPPAEALECHQRHHDCIESRRLGQSRVDVAAQVGEAEVGAPIRELDAPSR